MIKKLIDLLATVFLTVVLVLAAAGWSYILYVAVTP